MTAQVDPAIRPVTFAPTDRALGARLTRLLTLAVRTMGFTRIALASAGTDGRYRLAAQAGGGSGRLGPGENDICREVHLSGRSMIGSTTLAAVPVADNRSNISAVLVATHPGPVIPAESLSRLEDLARVIEDQLDMSRPVVEPPADAAAAIAELEAAIEAGEIVPWYQPIIELATGRTIGYEALARWEKPSGDVLDPGRFVQLAEDSDLIVALDLAVIAQALADISRWQRVDPALRLSLNLSGRHFDRDDCADAIYVLVQSAGVPPESIDLELTETVRLRRGDAVAKIIDDLRRHGFRIWLDDFGTGWASLEQLLQVRVDGLKVDRAFVAALDGRIGATLTQAVTSLATELGLRIVIEGVETQEQADLVKALGCVVAQGYLWSRPVPASAIGGSR
jgi:EAL domain-containing protein (putative c-di-GMP-specific phosphodiesterase class I)